MCKLLPKLIFAIYMMFKAILKDTLTFIFPDLPFYAGFFCGSKIAFGKIVQSADSAHEQVLSMEMRIAFNSLSKHSTIGLESQCNKAILLDVKAFS